MTTVVSPFRIHPSPFNSRHRSVLEFSQVQREQDEEDPEQDRVEPDDEPYRERSRFRIEHHQQSEKHRDHAAQNLRPFTGDLLSQSYRRYDLEDARYYRPRRDDDDPRRSHRR